MPISQLYIVIHQTLCVYKHSVYCDYVPCFNFYGMFMFTAIGTVLFEKRFGSFENPPSKEAQQFINAVQTVFTSMLELLIYPEWLAKVYQSKRLK